ncbi:MAG: hypothetical protein BWY93_02263 [Euryarchaeota archaeon ADurb.BinA087]|nr:MAG: hypothetical protein BWY93_02263 [Euryarchaeota archaeon ADurb.BinA087]
MDIPFRLLDDRDRPVLEIERDDEGKDVDGTIGDHGCGEKFVPAVNFLQFQEK